MLKQHVLSSGKVGFVDQQVDVAHRPKRKIAVHRLGQIRAFKHDDGDVVLVEQGQNLPQFMVESHVAGRVCEIGLVQGMDNVRGHLLLKFGGGEAVIEQGRDAVAPGQAEEVGPGYSDDG